MHRKLTILVFLLALLVFSASAAEEQTYIVKFNESLGTMSADGAAVPEHRNYCSATQEELEDYLRMGVVDYYEQDHAITLFDEIVTAASDKVWNLDHIKIQKAWDIGCFGNDVTVAVIDSGVYEHPLLKGKLLPGYNYIDNSSDTTDRIGHGTFVSGIIAADTYGVAPQVKIVPLKCFDSGLTTQTRMLADAIYDAIDVYDADVINLSVGVPESLITKTFQLSVEYAVKNGCIVVAAAGNDGTTTAIYPASYTNVIGVGSVNANNVRSSFSQHNASVDVVAPGEGLTGVSLDGYSGNAGTSFAAPHVSAAAAIVKCIKPNANTATFDSILTETCTDLGTAGKDEYYGYGAVDVEAMIDEVLKNTPVYISPITDNVARIFNNSGAKLTAAGFVAAYEKNKFLRARQFPLDLSPNEVKQVAMYNMGTTEKIFLLREGGLYPLYPAKIYER